MKKKKITSALAVLAVAAAGFTSCSDVDIEQFYLESIPDLHTTIAEESAAEPVTETTQNGDSSELDEDSEKPDVSDEKQPAETSAETDKNEDMFELSDADASSDSLAIEFTPEGSDSSEDIPADNSLSPLAAAYVKLIGDFDEQCSADPLMKREFCRYYIMDMNSDGTPELLAETGSCEADRTVYVYRYNGDEAEKLGSFVAWHAELGIRGGRLGCETKAMGSYLLTVVEITDGALTTQREDPTDESVLEQKLDSFGYDDTTGLNNL